MLVKDIAIDNGVLLVSSVQATIDLIGAMMTKRYIYNRQKGRTFFYLLQILDQFSTLWERLRVFLIDGAHFLEHLADQIPDLDEHQPDFTDTIE